MAYTLALKYLNLKAKVFFSFMRTWTLQPYKPEARMVPNKEALREPLKGTLLRT